MSADQAKWPLGERVARKSDKGGLLLRRWAGAWIDFIVLALLAVAPILVLVGPSDRLGATVIVVALVPVLLYFPLLEGLYGRSVGKWVTGTIVVDAQGDTPGIRKAALRTLLRLVEVNPFMLGGIPAGVCVMATEASQRIGDLAAKTYVVPVKELATARTAVDDPSIAAP